MSYITTTIGNTLSGGIDSLRLPTGGELAWSYGTIDFISQDPRVHGPENASTAYGVDKKEIFTNVSSTQGSSRPGITKVLPAVLLVSGSTTRVKLSGL